MSRCSDLAIFVLTDKPRVNNKEGKRVSNRLYTRYNMCLESDVTAHVTNSKG
jgi:hypothetical protein